MTRRIQVLLLALTAVLVLVALFRVGLHAPSEHGAPADPGDPTSKQPDSDDPSRALSRSDDVVSGASSDRATVQAAVPHAEPTIAEQSTLRVQVVARTTRAPVRGVLVDLTPASSERDFSSHSVHRSQGILGEMLMSGGDGRVEFSLAAARQLTLWASGREVGGGEAFANVPALAIGERRELRVELPVGDDLSFFGRVEARADHSPIVGARILLVTSNAHSPTEAITDSSGDFSIVAASWRENHLRVEADGFGLALVVPTAGHETRDSAMLVLLDREGVLRTRALDQSGATIRDAEVVVRCQGFAIRQPRSFAVGMFVPDPEWSNRSDARGENTIRGLPARTELKVELRKDDLTLVKRDVAPPLEPGETRDLELRISSGCAITGSVFDQSGRPVVERELWLVRAIREERMYFDLAGLQPEAQKAKTDATGHYLFEGVAPGAWSLGPAPIENPTEFDVSTLATIVHVPPDVSAVEVDLHVQRGLFIRGRVLDPAGTPAPNAPFFGMSVDSPRGLNAHTGPDGEFAFGPLDPGEYRLETFGAGESARSEPVTAAAGDKNVILQLRAGAGLAGRVVDSETGMSCSATVYVCRGVAENAGVMMGGTNGLGEFEFRGLEPGLLSVTACTPGGKIGVLRGVLIRAGAVADGLVVRLAAGARVSVRYEGKAEWASFRFISDGAIVAGDGLTPNSTRVEVVPAGRLTVRLHVLGRELPLEKDVDAVVGQQADVVFRD